MTTPTKSGMIAWIEIYIDPRNDRFSYVSDLRLQLQRAEIDAYTLERAIVQLQSFADRIRSDLPDQSAQFRQFADLLSEIPFPKIETTIAHYTDRSVVTIHGRELIDPIIIGSDVFITRDLSFEFDSGYYGSDYRDKAIEFASEEWIGLGTIDRNKEIHSIALNATSGKVEFEFLDYVNDDRNREAFALLTALAGDS